jgi:hypothetical protein
MCSGVGRHHQAAMNALLVRSLLSDGEFVRLMHKKPPPGQEVRSLHAAAAKAGEMQCLRRDLCVCSFGTRRFL